MSDDTLIQFLGAPLPQSGPPEGSGALVAHCPSCGQSFGSQGKFCPFCGEPLAVGAAPHKPVVDDVRPGRIIDERYRVERVLGSGGMGTVYEVTHTLLQRRMALKVLRPELAGVDDLSARFLREARAAAAIEHPNVVRISDFGTLGSGQAYFVMELLAGMPLRSLVATGRIPADRVAIIARQVADGLSAAHRAGIVHRDLKPDNVQVDPKAGDFVKVLDFGLARVAGASRLTKQGVVFGTPQYMSPEQAAGENVDHRSDIYGLGVMMYEMLTGSVPFESETYMGVLSMHLRTPPVPPHRVVDAKLLGGLEPIVLRALAKHPDERFSNMVELMDAIDHRSAERIERRVFGIGAPRPKLDSARQNDVRLAESDRELVIPGLPRAGASSDLSRLLLPAGLGAAVAAVTVVLALNVGKSELAPAPAPQSAVSPSRGTPEADTKSAPSPAEPSTVAAAAPTPEPAAQPPASASASASVAKSVPHKGSQTAQPAAAPREAAPAEAAEEPAPPPKRKKRYAEIVDPWAEE